MKKIIISGKNGFLYEQDKQLIDILIYFVFLDYLRSVNWMENKKLQYKLQKPGFECCIIKMDIIRKKCSHLARIAKRKGIMFLILPQIPGTRANVIYAVISSTDRCRFFQLLEVSSLKQYKNFVNEVEVFEYMEKIVQEKS